MVKTVRKVARDEAIRVAETKTVGRVDENRQLFHNVPDVRGPYLRQVALGLGSGNNLKNPNTRIGSEIYLQEFACNYWLSNKLDRPNVMYRIITFWYAQNMTSTTPSVNDIFFWNQAGTIPNVMILRTNDDVIQVISDKFVFSDANYAQPTYYPVGGTVAVLGKERSQLKFVKKKFKNKKIKYNDDLTGIGATGVVKNKDIFVAIMAYDAYGTLTTDNICSYSENSRIMFKDP